MSHLPRVAIPCIHSDRVAYVAGGGGGDDSGSTVRKARLRWVGHGFVAVSFVKHRQVRVEAQGKDSFAKAVERQGKSSALAAKAVGTQDKCTVLVGGVEHGKLRVEYKMPRALLDASHVPAIRCQRRLQQRRADSLRLCSVPQPHAWQRWVPRWLSAWCQRPCHRRG